MITNDAGEALHTTPMTGTVLDNKDPKGLCRVKVLVPSLYGDEDGPWARPLGTAGVQSGLWNPPDIGSEVVLWFVAGDPDYPRYERGQHTQSTRPEFVQRAIDESSEEDVGAVTAKVRTIETADWDISIDEREGRRLFRARAKGLGSQDPDGSSLMIEMDREQGVLALSAPLGISLRTNGRIELVGLDIIIGGRRHTQGIAKDS